MAESSTSVSITTEEFNAFHTIDRRLFTKLIFNLARDVEESTQIMALWIWIERQSFQDLLVQPLLALPLPLVDAICDESILCLKAIKSDVFPFPQFTGDTPEIPLLRTLLRMDVSMRFFHENRVKALHGVCQIVRDVCLRAFWDIVEHKRKALLLYSLVNAARVAGGGRGAENVNLINWNITTGSLGLPETMLSRVVKVGEMSVPVEQPSGTRQELSGSGSGSGSGSAGSRDSYSRMVAPPSVEEHSDHARRALHEQLHDMSRRVSRRSSREEREEQEEQVPADERTIFLTFSKGYPISYTEVDHFFKRLFGDVIESIRMQEVESGEQALYARLVLRNAAAIQVILRGQSKVKFSISGKHAWARKYVRKNTPSPPNTPSRIFG